MGKKWKNAPVMYVLAQVKFNQILSMETFVPAIQEEMRKIGFPDYRKEIVNLLHFPIGQSDTGTSVQTVNRYIFGDMDNRSGFNLESNAIAFQSADYGVFEAFLQTFLKGISIVDKNVKLDFIERTGIRYLDAVIPKNDELLQDYLITEVLGLIKKVTGKWSHSYTETVSKNDMGAVLIARTIIQDSQVSLPSDITPLAYELLPRFKVSGLHAVIDTDGYYEERALFDINAIGSKLNNLHEEISKLFRASVLDHAINIWESGE